MTIRPTHFLTILGIAPATRGFGFAILEQRGRLVAWGVARLYSPEPEEFVERLVAMMARYKVGCLCLEDPPHPRHGRRTRSMLCDAAAAATSRGATVRGVSRERVREQLGLPDASAKRMIAVHLAAAFDELAPLVPAPRRPWESEDRRMKIFEALALAACGNAGSRAAVPDVRRLMF